MTQKDKEELLFTIENVFECAIGEKIFLGLEKSKKAKDRILQLIERDTAKKPVDAVEAYCNGMPVVVAGQCPNCGADRTRQDSFCNCGQRLDWKY